MEKNRNKMIKKEIKWKKYERKWKNRNKMIKIEI